jgi:gluconolactonase
VARYQQQHRFSPGGQALGRIRQCANLAFGGPNRDRLFTAANQSLYVIQLTDQGAAPG